MVGFPDKNACWMSWWIHGGADEQRAPQSHYVGSGSASGFTGFYSESRVGVRLCLLVMRSTEMRSRKVGSRPSFLWPLISLSVRWRYFLYIVTHIEMKTQKIIDKNLLKKCR